MLLQPRKVKHKKLKKNYLSNLLETNSNKLQNGFIGLQAMESTRLTARQIEAARQCINRVLRRRGKI